METLWKTLSLFKIGLIVLAIGLSACSKSKTATSSTSTDTDGVNYVRVRYQGSYVCMREDLAEEYGYTSVN